MQFKIYDEDEKVRKSRESNANYYEHSFFFFLLNFSISFVLGIIAFLICFCIF